MKTASGESILGGRLVLGARPFCLWCVEPEKEPGPDLGPTVTSDPTLSPPARGEHAEQTACRLRGRPIDRTPRSGATAMEILHRCCAGLDVHKRSVVACVRAVGPDGQAVTETRTFGTVTAELLALADWLEGRGAR